MKSFLVILFCLLAGFSVFGQTEEPQNLTAAVVGIEDVYLAKDDGAGKAGEAVESFFTTDIPIYCVVVLDSVKPTLVKMNFVAVDVKGVKPETRVITVSYKTNGNQNRVYFTGRPEGAWVAGTYRIDIFIDGKLAGERTFEIKKSATEIQKKPLPTEVQNVVAPKPPPKIARRSRKN
jgi:hypothetical protein